MNALFIEVLGFAAGAFIATALIPQAIKTIRTKDTQSISLGMYSIYTCGCISWVLYGILIGSPSMMFWNSISFILSVFILISKIRYG